MELPFFAIPAFLSIGAVAGVLTSVIGVGGSLVVIPALLAMLPALNVPPHAVPSVALGTSLCVSFPIAIMSAYRHFRLGNLTEPFSADKLVLMLCAGTGAFLGAKLVTSIPAYAPLCVIGAAQLYFCYGILRPARVASVGQVRPFDSTASLSRAYMGAVGLLTSMGAGGSLIVPFLTVKGVEHPKAVALAGWLGVLIGLSSLVVFATRPNGAHGSLVFGAIHIPAALALGFGSFAAIRFAAPLATRLNPIVLRRALGVFLVLSSARIFSQLTS
jgi:uncharacterized protein